MFITRIHWIDLMMQGLMECGLMESVSSFVVLCDSVIRVEEGKMIQVDMWIHT